MKDIKLKIIIFLTIVLYIVALSITMVKLVNWQNEYDCKDEQIKILKQSLNEQIEEKQVYMNLLEGKEKIRYENRNYKKTRTIISKPF